VTDGRTDRQTDGQIVKVSEAADQYCYAVLISRRCRRCNLQDQYGRGKSRLRSVLSTFASWRNHVLVAFFSLLIWISAQFGPNFSGVLPGPFPANAESSRTKAVTVSRTEHTQRTHNAHHQNDTWLVSTRRGIIR